MLKIYLSILVGHLVPYAVAIAMFDELKLPSMKKKQKVMVAEGVYLLVPSMKKKQKVMVAEVVYLLRAYARNPAG